jgi:hypothetical protein
MLVRLVRSNVAGYAETTPMDWWMTEGDRDPVGPVSTELVLERIEAGEVPKDTLICEVGGTSWKWIGEVGAFSAALDEDQRHRFDPENEQTPLDPVALDEFLNRPDKATERPTAQRSRLRPSEAPPRAWAEHFDDPEENTLVDSVPLRPSEPPTEP